MTMYPLPTSPILTDDRTMRMRIADWHTSWVLMCLREHPRIIRVQLAPWAQEAFAPYWRTDLRNFKTPLRWFPEIIIKTKNFRLLFVDAKGEEPGRTTENHAIERDSLQSALQTQTYTGFPVLFVFADGRTASATALAQSSHRRPGPPPKEGRTLYDLWPASCMTPLIPPTPPCPDWASLPPTALVSLAL